MIPLRRPQDVVQFTPDAAERIGRAVLSLENAVPAGKPLKFDALPPAARKVFHVGTFTGAWPIYGSQTVTLAWPTSPPQTVVAQNILVDVPDAGLRNCAIGKDGTAWYLVFPQVGTATVIVSLSISATLNTTDCTITVEQDATTATVITLEPL